MVLITPGRDLEWNYQLYKPFDDYAIHKKTMKTFNSCEKQMASTEIS